MIKETIKKQFETLTEMTLEQNQMINQLVNEQPELSAKIGPVLAKLNATISKENPVMITEVINELRKFKT